MGANLTDDSMQRATTAATTLHQTQSNFDKETEVPVSTCAHSTWPDDAYVLRVPTVVCKEELLKGKPDRCYTRFNKITKNPLSNLKIESIETWIDKKIKQAVKYTEPQGEGNLSDSDASDNSEDD